MTPPKQRPRFRAPDPSLILNNHPSSSIFTGETPPAPSAALPSPPPAAAPALADDEHISNNNNKDEEATNHESLPPNGYVVAGKMNLGATISVPPPNSAHLRRDFKKLMPPFVHGRSESLSSGSSCLPHLQALETESISERESISPLRLEVNNDYLVTDHRVCARRILGFDFWKCHGEMGF